MGFSMNRWDEKLLKYGAKGFISYSGDITDTPDNSDLENKELRDVLRNKGGHHGR